MTAKMLEAARSYVAAGLSVIPVLLDGTKKPFAELLPKRSWKPFQSERATDSQLQHWFGDRPGAGIAILGGIISGGLEVLDFDSAAVFDQWATLLREQVPALLARLALVRTPSGGAHAYYRVSPWPGQGNQKLARDLAGVALIETRAEGGYVLAPPCPGYARIGGPPLTRLATLTGGPGGG
jgi:hypothetical protein